jgi:hypothetical protein
MTLVAPPREARAAFSTVSTDWGHGRRRCSRARAPCWNAAAFRAKATTHCTWSGPLSQSKRALIVNLERRAQKTMTAAATTWYWQRWQNCSRKYWEGDYLMTTRCELLFLKPAYVFVRRPRIGTTESYIIIITTTPLSNHRTTKISGVDKATSVSTY